MSSYINPNTQHQIYYQTPDQSQQASVDLAAAAEPKVYAVPQNYAEQQISPPTASFLGLDLSSATFWKGAVIGAGVALLVSSETVQKAVVKTVSRGMAAASAGIEELKEKFEDAKAEVEAEAAEKK